MAEHPIVLKEPLLRRIRLNPAAPVYVLTVFVFAMALATSEDFRSLYNLNNVAIQTIALGIAALAQTFAILAGDVDLCVGGTISLVTVVCATMMKESAGSIFGICVLCLFCGVLIGVLNGILTSIIDLDAMVTTFASNSALMGFALWVMPAPGGEVPYEYMQWIELSLWGFPVPLLLLLFLLAVSCWVLERSSLGVHICALGGGRRSAFTSGINLTATRIAAHVIAGALAALAGLFLTARMGSGDALAGAPFSLDSMTAVIAGGAAFSTGVGSVTGSVTAAFLITVLGNMFNHWGVSTYWQYVFKGLLLVLAVTASALRDRLSERHRSAKGGDAA